MCVLSHLRTCDVCAEVRAKSILKGACDVRACGSFLAMLCAIALFHTFLNKITRFSVLERHFPVLERPFLIKYTFENHFWVMISRIVQKIADMYIKK
jgi:hypothetical protein